VGSDTRTATRSGPGFEPTDWIGWMDARLFALCAVSTVIVVLGGLVQVSFGAYSMSVVEAWHAVFDPAVLSNPDVILALLLGGELPELENATLIVWNIRLPRVLVAILVGATLAVSGAIFQAVTRNELASPYILGVSSGAGLAVILTLVVFGSLAYMLPVIAALGGLTAFLAVYAIAWKGGTSPVRLVLAGVIVATVLNSLQTGLFFFADDLGVVKAAISWTTGSLTGTDWEQVRIAIVPALLSLAVAVLASRQLNVLLLGERTAASLGMNVELVRFLLATVGVIAAAAAVAVAGLVGFVGLIVPHVVRNTVGSNYTRLIVGCVFVGPALMVAADVGARLALSPVQLPVGIVTGLVGGPYFLYLMRKKHELGDL